MLAHRRRARVAARAAHAACGAWAALAALTAVLPALVYAYELFGSVKEVTALSMILTLGCLVGRCTAAGCAARPLARFRSRSCSPPASRRSGSRSARGRSPRSSCSRWCSWRELRGRRLRARRRPSLLLLGVGALTLADRRVADLEPTCPDRCAVAQDIASTSNSGNLHAPLRAVQVLGVWLHGSYKLAPSGAALAATHVLIALAFARRAARRRAPAAHPRVRAARGGSR